MRCPQCGHLSETGAAFCSRCGSALSAADAETTAMFSIIDLESDHEEALSQLSPGEGMLVVLKGPEAGTRFLLERSPIRLGRHPESDIFLNDITVSRRHAEVRSDGGRYIVDDRGSLNGTYVNRERVDTAQLHSGDELQVGKFRLLFLEGPKR